MKLVKSATSDLAGGIYSYLDNENRIVLVNADGNLQRISHTQQSDSTWQLSVDSSVQIGYPDVVGLVPDYQGRVWFTTAQGTSPSSGAVVGYYNPTTSQTSAIRLPAGKQIANSISSSPTDVAVASTSALYLFQPGSSGPEEVWREPYDNGPARKPGQLSWGTGAVTDQEADTKDAHRKRSAPTHQAFGRQVESSAQELCEKRHKGGGRVSGKPKAIQTPCM
jgi:streptogramin lyase